MAIHNLNIAYQNKGSMFLCIVLAIICTSCLANRHKSHHVSQNKEIVYHVFDSLEQILCKGINDIKRRHPNNCSSICVTITPSGNYLMPYGDNNIYKYSINIFYSIPASKRLILNAADRYVQICENVYPVYFYSLDDIFAVPDSIKNLTNSIPALADSYSEIYLEVNMSTKKVIFKL